MTIGAVGTATGSAVGAAQARDRNTPPQPRPSNRSHRFATARRPGRGHGRPLVGAPLRCAMALCASPVTRAPSPGKSGSYSGTHHPVVLPSSPLREIALYPRRSGPWPRPQHPRQREHSNRSHRFATARRSGRGHGPLLHENRPLERLRPRIFPRPGRYRQKAFAPEGAPTAIAA